MCMLQDLFARFIRTDVRSSVRMVCVCVFTRENVCAQVKKHIMCVRACVRDGRKNKIITKGALSLWVLGLIKLMRHILNADDLRGHVNFRQKLVLGCVHALA